MEYLKDIWELKQECEVKERQKEIFKALLKLPLGLSAVFAIVWVGHTYVEPPLCSLTNNHFPYNCSRRFK